MAVVDVVVAQNLVHRQAQRDVAVDQLAEVGERHAGELPDVDHQMAAAGDVLVNDVHAGTVVELRVLQALRGVELAVRRRRVVAFDVAVVFMSLSLSLALMMD